MVFDEALHGICNSFLHKNFDESNENMCEKCFKMNDNLEVRINELKSAHLIIKILQEEVKSTSTGPGNQDNLKTVLSINPTRNITLLRERTVHGNK
jgi:hypothetical protein